uniref:Triadin n=1 Tax=Oryzias sinensis TaxID=183150 RepID=A0A8C7WPK7_9TELE
MVIDSKNGEAGTPSGRMSKKTFTDDLHSTFSSPLAWILVLALLITWTCVFVIMFDLMDYKTISGTIRTVYIFFSFPLKHVYHPPSGIRKVWKDPGHRGGINKISSDPMKVVNDAVEESSNVFTAILNFGASLIAPEEEGIPKNLVSVHFAFHFCYPVFV